MRLVRFSTRPAQISPDIRAALTALSRGEQSVDGVGLVGVQPPDSDVAVDAVVVTPHGAVVVVGVDLPDPAIRLEAPLGDVWKADGWPLVRGDDSTNPSDEAVALADRVAARIRTVAPGTPVGTVIAVGPFVEHVEQPPEELGGTVRIVYPTSTSLLAALVSLATAQQPCTVAQARAVLADLSPDTDLDDDALTAEGFGTDATTPASTPAPKPAPQPEPTPKPQPSPQPEADTSTDNPLTDDADTEALDSLTSDDAPATTPLTPSASQVATPALAPSTPMPQAAPRSPAPAPATPPTAAAPAAPTQPSPAPSTAAQPTPAQPPVAQPAAASAPPHPAPAPSPAPQPPQAGQATPPQPAPTPTASPQRPPWWRRLPRQWWGWLSAAGAFVVGVVVIVTFSLLGGDDEDEPIRTRAGGLEFTQRAAQLTDDCATHAVGDLRVVLADGGCTGLRRGSFDTTVDGTNVAVSVSALTFTDRQAAQRFLEVADTPGTGTVGDLATETNRWSPPAPGWSGAAYVSDLEGTTVRLVLATPRGQGSAESPEVTRAAEAALDLVKLND
ncbi:hypothetical protein BJF85_00140 [Saccharomonospora sp. CUA-673]|uniref:hypothetical protein n=1 Tax=Saccharomonospora sp. CUA-673 TaxID=1904969 RepID=UPI00095BCFA9|nr:hypothetical protein [Saccharomonospora sp. CUA-673]OLT46925.1 hypothetical protein BJF85_00140 [Saccharomonospora sp. CUA-673]